MKKQTTKLGNHGEDLACEYLVKKSYNILRRNYREKWGEIDIIARAKDRTLVFVEVKALTGSGGAETLQLARGGPCRIIERTRLAASGGEGLKPEDHLTSAKLRKLRRTCEMFVAKNKDLLDEKRGWRIDLVAIEFALKPGKEPEMRHYENI